MVIQPLDSWLEAHNIHGTALIKVILCVDTVESLLEAPVAELAKTLDAENRDIWGPGEWARFLHAKANPGAAPVSPALEFAYHEPSGIASAPKVPEVEVVWAEPDNKGNAPSAADKRAAARKKRAEAAVTLSAPAAKPKPAKRPRADGRSEEERLMKNARCRLQRRDHQPGPRPAPGPRPFEAWTTRDVEERKKLIFEAYPPGKCTPPEAVRTQMLDLMAELRRR
mmetsp:Transcript_3111/g.9095  ORF Transcript_3111/g.9095 Transcript_3111/m.9095 type:complete len:225 (-) Transcript_3111:53-727(-)